MPFGVIVFLYYAGYDKLLDVEQLSILGEPWRQYRIVLHENISPTVVEAKVNDFYVGMFRYFTLDNFTLDRKRGGNRSRRFRFTQTLFDFDLHLNCVIGQNGTRILP